MLKKKKGKKGGKKRKKDVDCDCQVMLLSVVGKHTCSVTSTFLHEMMVAVGLLCDADCLIYWRCEAAGCLNLAKTVSEILSTRLAHVCVSVCVCKVLKTFEGRRSRP